MKRLAVGLVLVVACGKSRDGGGDELTIVVQGDRRELDQQERSLREREDSLRKEKAALDARIAELSKNLKAAADAQQKTGIEEELRHEQDIAAQMTAKERALAEQKSQMEQKKQALDAEQAKTAIAGREAQTLAREAQTASREARIAEREASVSAREKDLVEREKALETLQAQVLQLQQQLVAQLGKPGAPVPNGGRDVPRAQLLDQKHKKLLADIADRGILITDLPSDEQPLNAEIWAARRQGDIPRAMDLVADLQKAVQKLKVDQKFVEQKMLRLQDARSSAKLADGQRAEIEKLLRAVTASYSDGKYEEANKGLNQIASILDASAASG